LVLKDAQQLSQGSWILLVGRIDRMVYNGGLILQDTRQKIEGVGFVFLYFEAPWQVTSDTAPVWFII